MEKEDKDISSRRKQDHIELAFSSRIGLDEIDQRFDYEPIFSAHPNDNLVPIVFLNKKLRIPLWVSSMTGGTEKAKKINHNLARACREFGMGMGLGSCRSLLYEDAFFADFDVRSILGSDLPLFANLGISQIESLLKKGETDRIDELIYRLQADGLIVHINPLQEALQPEGDILELKPISVIEQLLGKISWPIIVKEVGQGMGRQSIRALLQLPLAALDFGASGGTNFALLELLRKDADSMYLKPLARVGHSAEEMVDITNELIDELGVAMLCKEIIISGGITDFLDGYYLMEKLRVNSVYGQASVLLKYALEGYRQLHEYLATQARGLELARAYLKIK